MMLRFTFIIVLLSAVALTGCVRVFHHTPDPSTFQFDPIPEFALSKPVTLVNGQQSTSEILYASHYAMQAYGNRREWSDTAITITARELELRGATIADDADTELELAITSITATSGGWGWRVSTTLAVKTSDGYEATYFGEGPSPSALRAADASVMRSVAAMLTDENIVAYLTR